MHIRAVLAAVTAFVLLVGAFPPYLPTPAAAQNLVPPAPVHHHDHEDHETDPNNPVAMCATALLHERDFDVLQSLSYRPLNEIGADEFRSLGLDSSSQFGKLDTVGQTKQFWADNVTTGARYQISATLKRETAHGYIYVENGRSISNGTLDKIASDWEVIYERTTGLFGAPPDVDGDPHITILLLDILDGFDGRGGYVAGYFTARNQLPDRFSNVREMVYVDTNPGIPADDGTLATIAHEFEHMINWNYHKAAHGQETWLNEGLAEFAAYNAGYGHTSNLRSFLSNPNEDLLHWGYDTPDYGASYLFTLYLWEKYGGDPLIRALAQHPGLSVDAVDAVLQSMGATDRFRNVFEKWVIANYLGDDQASGGIYGYRSLKLVDSLTPGDPSNNVTTFRRPPLASSYASYPATANNTVNWWAAKYYRFTGTAGVLNLKFGGGSGSRFVFGVASSSSGDFAPGSNIAASIPISDGASATIGVEGLGCGARAVLVVATAQGPLTGRSGSSGYLLSGGPAGSQALGEGVLGPPPSDAAAGASPAAPKLTLPVNGRVLGKLGTQLSWALPAGSTQYQLQVAPFNGDGPGINLIRNAEEGFTIPTPELGRGDYIMLPGMTYTWRVRATSKVGSAAENDPSWGPWSTQKFCTMPPATTGIQAVSPANNATVASAAPIALNWSHPDPSVYYFEVQVSGDTRFDPDPATASSFVWWNLVHGGMTTPVSSWTTPPLQPNAPYFWRVRPRVQGDGIPVEWSPAFSFRTGASTPAPTATATPVATASPSPSPTSSPVATATPIVETLPVLEAQVLTLINAERVKNGVLPMAPNARLTSASQRHSMDMAAGGFLDHRGSDGSEFNDRAAAAGYVWTGLGEVIAVGTQDAGAVVTAWMNSSPQRAILMTASHREAGAGVVRASNGSYYWTVLAGAPK